MIRIKARMPVPKKRTGDFERMLKDVGGKLADRVSDTYEELTGDWKQDGERPIDTPVIFQKELTRDSGGLLVEVKTNSLKYRYVDLGTEPHPIYPKQEGGLLVFPSKYTPRTKPGVLKTGSGGKDYSSPIIFTRYVKRHPGIKEPRNFEEKINKQQKFRTYKDLAVGYLKMLLGSYEIKEEEYD